MKKNRITKVFSILVFMIIIIGTKIYGASITGNSSVKVGDTVTLTYNFGENVGAYDNITVSYDTGMFEYVSGDSLKEGVWWDSTNESKGISSKTYTFRALKEGSSRITVVATGVISANNEMTPLGTLTAEKLINVSNPEPVEPPTNQNNPPVTSGTVTNTPTDNGNNYLKYLQISEEGLNPNFSRNITNYSISVGENVNSIQVLARAEDPNARVEISGHESIAFGDNTISIKVTAQNGYYRIYTITVTKTNDKEKSNAYLESLIVENYNFDSEFQSEVLEYNLGKILPTVKSLNVIASAKDPKAKIEIIGADKLADLGDGEVTIKVTAQDGKTVKEYKIKYIIESSDEEEVINQTMKDYLKDIKNNTSKKDIAVLYLKYIWLAIKKNYLLILMYLLILIEFIQIIVLRRKLKKKDYDLNDTPPKDKEILKIEKENSDEKVEEKMLDVSQDENKDEVKMLSQQMAEEKINNDMLERMSRRGSLERNITKADGIKLVDLDKNEGPKDELTFNIFDNLTDDDIKRMLDEQIDEDK